MMSTKLAVGSLSLGQHPSHHLDHKIELAAKYGFSGVEVVYSDLENFSKRQNISMLEGARIIKQLCQDLRLDVISLAPFENYEGSDAPLQERLERARHWLDLAAALGATYLQVPAQFEEVHRRNKPAIVSELQQLADLGTAVSPIVAIAYEPMSWSVHNSTWEEALATINAVDRANFGLCLDNFHIHTKLWASPFTKSGKYPDADAILTDSLRRFRDTFPLEKLFFIQLSDAERFDPPFSQSHPWYLEGEAPEFTWSKHARPFPLERDLGGYLPVTQFLQTCVIDQGFRGWVSLEIFDRQMRDESYKPEMAANRAIQSWKRLKKQVCQTDFKL